MKWYYPATGKQTAQAAYKVYHIGFRAANIILANAGNSGNDLVLSWDGVNDHFHVGPGEPLNLGNLEFEEVWIKDGAGTTQFRIAAYAR